MNRKIDRREFLAGGLGALGVSSLSGCLMVAGSTDPSMEPFQDVEGLEPMFKGAPVMDDYPAGTEHVAMTMPGGMEMEMDAVTIEMIAPEDETDNFHFMPHVAWIEPGQTVFWRHFVEKGISQPQPHTITSFGAGGQFPRLIPEEAEHFDSGFRAGTHSAGAHGDEGGDEHGGEEGGDDHGDESPAERPAVDRRVMIDERFNRNMVDRIGNEGGMSVTFEQEGVYFYYCQNHHMFMMAGAVVVGPLYGDHGNAHPDVATENPPGWGPAMTMDGLGDRIREADEVHGDALAGQVEELRMLVKSGGEMGDGHGGDDH